MVLDSYTKTKVYHNAMSWMCAEYQITLFRCALTGIFNLPSHYVIGWLDMKDNLIS